MEVPVSTDRVCSVLQFVATRWKEINRALGSIGFDVGWREREIFLRSSIKADM